MAGDETMDVQHPGLDPGAPIDPGTATSTFAAGDIAGGLPSAPVPPPASPSASARQVLRRGPAASSSGGGAADVGAMTIEEALAEEPIRVQKLGDHLVADFQAAQRFEPKHDKLALLGKGAMGQVFVARDRDLKRTVAVKSIDPRLDEDGHALRRFYAEAQITAQLEHPSIVPVYDLTVDPSGQFSYSMKVVRGETLKEYIAETKRQYTDGGPDEDHGLADRLEIFLSICNAMSYAHSRGVIHRDLKPENIMLGAFHEVIVMDWGIATLRGVKPDIRSDAMIKPTSAHETQMGMIVGTPLYMAPEQARGENRAVSAKSDQCSLGLILYELVTLKRGYAGKTVVDIVMAAAEGRVEPVQFFNGKERVPRELKAIIRKATALDPESRYEDVAALAADVRRFAQNESVHAAPDGFTQKLGRWMSRNRARALSIGLGILLAAVVVSGGIFISGQAALADQREQAEAREHLLSKLMGQVSQRAQAINGAFDHWTAQLTGMNAAAEVALSGPVAPDQYYYACRDPKTSPKDLAPSSVFFKPVSVDWLCVEVAPGVAKDGLETRFKQLATLSHPFRKARLSSADFEALELPRSQQGQRVRNKALPVLFAYMGLEEGVMATYPGRDTTRDDYDPRKRPWYKQAKDRRGPLWLAIDTKSERKGLVVTGSLASRHPSTDQLLGVTAVDVEMSYLIDHYLQLPKGFSADTTEVYLLTGDGIVIVQSSMRDVADELKSFETKPFPHKALLKRFETSSAGHASAKRSNGGEDLVLWTRIPATGWTYAVVADEAIVMEETPR